MALGVSNLGTFLAQTTSITNMRTTLDDLQRQISTGKKATTYAGLDGNVQEVQRLRADITILDNYQKAIDTASVRTSVMNTSLNEINDLALELRDGLSSLTAESSEPNFAYVKELAQTSLSFLNQLLNTEVNGRHLFSGSGTTTKPLENLPRLEANAESEAEDWLSGAITTEEFLENIAGLQGQDLGYALDLQSATKVEARIDDGYDVNYTVLANEEGFQDLLRVTATLAAMEFPDETDPFTVADKEDFFSAIRSLSGTLDESIDNISVSQTRLTVAITNMDRAKAQHAQDQNALQILVDNIENVDTATAVTLLRQTENQLNASYQSISTLANLSLVNFL
ncbi:MAG: hypothetical protein CMP22_03880 [Rickettsiales bacterium]|nr:hypothetical protein [Rickettsiales bacterium]